MTRRFTLSVDMDNAAFGDGPGDWPPELARILRDVAVRVVRQETDGAIRDINGNRVGTFAFYEGDEPSN